MLQVFYYYYYLFYSKVHVQDDPHFVTILALSASESFIISGAIDLLVTKFYCVGIGKWSMLSIGGLIIATNFILYNKKEQQRIVKEKPSLFGSEKLSRIIVYSFFVLSVSWLFWGAPLAKYLLEQCR